LTAGEIGRFSLMKKEATPKDQGKKDNAGVIAPPPLIFLAFVILGLGIHRFFPMSLVSDEISGVFGPIFVILPITTFILAVRQFSTARTSVKTHEPTSAIITSGPYRFSRNPIYLAMVLQHFGIALWVNTLWLLATLVLVIPVITVGVILREERYLEPKFGDTYLEYKKRTRRWL